MNKRTHFLETLVKDKKATEFVDSVGKNFDNIAEERNKIGKKVADYIDIGVFGEEKINGDTKSKELYLKKHKITAIHNKITLVVNEKPIEVGVDPYNKLIDTNSNDNRRKF